MHFVCNSGHVDGSLNGGINQEGLDHYNNVIDELLKNGKTLNFTKNSDSISS